MEGCIRTNYRTNVNSGEHNERHKETINISTVALSSYGDLLGVADLAEVFGVSKQTIYKELHEGKFGKPIRIGRTYKISKIFIARNFIFSD